MKKIVGVLFCFCSLTCGVDAARLCGKECNANSEGVNIYCEKYIYKCENNNGSYEYRVYDYVLNMCHYDDPLTRRSLGNEETLWDTDGPDWGAVFGNRKLNDGDEIQDLDPNFCMGCRTTPNLFFYGGKDYLCLDNQDEAWCMFQKNNNGLNVDWSYMVQDCICKDPGMKWDGVNHVCVPGTRSDEEKCGVRCNATNDGKFFYCDNMIYKCYFDSFDNLYVFSMESFFDYCQYDNPLTRVSGGRMESNYGSSGETKIWGDTILSNGEEVTNRKLDFCIGCSDNAYMPCTQSNIYCFCNFDLNESWCWWRRKEENKNVVWKNNECKCLDSGKRWDIDIHDCVSKKRTCEELYPNGSAERLACCRAGKATTWAGTETSGTCSCVDTNKQWKYTAGSRTGQCVTKTVSNKTCAEMHPGNSEAIACCEFGKNGGAEWKGNKCNCFGENKKWEYSDNIKAGHCVDDKKTEEKNEKKSEVKNNNIDCVIELGASVQCKNGTKFNKNATVSLSAEKCNLYKSNVAKYLNEISGLLCESAGGVGNVITNAQVKAATDNINRFFEYAKSNANVWKNADGKFNTARLASDATAGVILGTVGGIVSAKIIKKKQVEKGFDALNCTVGGQKVADWGDEFTVGFGR